MSSPDRRVILITGANKGIGLQALKLLSERLPSTTLLLGTRSLANGQAALTQLQSDRPSSYTNIHPIVLDVTDPTSIARAVEEVKSTYGHLDVLLNNSGISNVNGDRMSPGIFDVNLHGVHRTVTAFLPLMPPGSLLVTVSSEVGSWTTSKVSGELQARLLDPKGVTYEGLSDLATAFLTPPHSPWPNPSTFGGVYGVSKALASPYTRMVALHHPEMKVVVVCPGYCATDLNGHRGHRAAALGGESIIYPVIHGEAESGKFYQDGIEMEWSCSPPAWYQPPPPPMPK